MNLNYYPGCTLHGTAHDFHESILAVFGALATTVMELDDWNCCGASSAHVMNPEAAWMLPARNLLIAAGVDRPLLTPCAACYHRLKLAQHHLEKHPQDHPDAEAAIAVEVVHVNDMLVREELLQRIKQRITRPLAGLRVVPYYGCLTVRPPRAIRHPHPENPTEMDLLLRVMAADVRNWSYKTDCCGGNHALTRPDLVRMLSGKLFEAAGEAGAEAIVTDCPMCQANLDTRQQEIEKERGTSFGMPVLYITEVLAIAMGLPQAQHWWRKHLVDPVPMLRSKGWAA